MSLHFPSFFFVLLLGPTCCLPLFIITELEGVLSSLQQAPMSRCGTIIASLISTSVRRSKKFCTRWSSQRVSKHNKRRKEICKNNKMERDKEGQRLNLHCSCYLLPSAFLFLLESITVAILQKNTCQSEETDTAIDVFFF